MNCPHCGSELESEDATICPKCGESIVDEETETQQDVIEAPQKQTDLLLVASIVTMIAATFVASLGYLGVFQYVELIDYYVNYYGLSYSAASDFALGFFIFGIDGLVAGAFALAGAFLMLKRKWFMFSMVGTIFPLASVFVTFVCIQQYNYGFTDILIFAEVAAAMFAFIGIFLTFASRKEYV